MFKTLYYIAPYIFVVIFHGSLFLGHPDAIEKLLWKMQTIQTSLNSNSTPLLPRGATQIYIGVHMREQKKEKRKEKKKQVERSVFCSRTYKATNAFRGLKCHVSGKRGWFCQNLLQFFRLKPI